jgi:hypothetical protein
MLIIALIQCLSHRSGSTDYSLMGKRTVCFLSSGRSLGGTGVYSGSRANLSLAAVVALFRPKNNQTVFFFPVEVKNHRKLRLLVKVSIRFKSGVKRSIAHKNDPAVLFHVELGTPATLCVEPQYNLHALISCT